ncbi:MAG: hypothetical protein ACT4OX_03160 [Actinomycetota bacterium]
MDEAVSADPGELRAAARGARFAAVSAPGLEVGALHLAGAGAGVGDAERRLASSLGVAMDALERQGLRFAAALDLVADEVEGADRLEML